MKVFSPQGALFGFACIKNEEVPTYFKIIDKIAYFVVLINVSETELKSPFEVDSQCYSGNSAPLKSRATLSVGFVADSFD